MRRNRSLKTACIVTVFLLAAAVTSPAQTFTNLLDFNQSNGGSTASPLVQGTDGNFYGTSPFGANQQGTVFKITPDGALTTVYNFCSKPNCLDGSGPAPGLLLAPNGNFYGMTGSGGANENGTIFEMSPSGQIKTIYNFCTVKTSGGWCADGNQPVSPLVLGINGNMYGTTYGGGQNADGTVFEVSSSGVLKTLYSFCSLNPEDCSDGAQPEAGLMLGSDGNFYGTTFNGGAQGIGRGTVFKMTPQGKLTTIHQFCTPDACANYGENPESGLAEGGDGNFYGTTYYGGKSNAGTVFKITPGGKITLLHSFCTVAKCADGGRPGADLALGTDGNFYGVTSVEGTKGYGTFFQMTPAGQLTTLYSFCSEKDCADGETPDAMPLQATNGTFYAVTFRGGIAGCLYDTSCGIVYSLSNGLGPFVQSSPGFGKAGYTLNILGNALTGTTSVTFNGLPAANFTVVSDTYIKAQVPAGATTGTISVTTPSGTLTSNAAFRVLQ